MSSDEVKLTESAQSTDTPNPANANAAWGAGNTAWQTDQFQDGYQENIYAVNFGDTPYTETADNPNPQSNGYKSLSYGSSDDEELEL